MKATGIVRRIDDLGRVVIPKEIRRTMRIREGDPLGIFTDREGEVIFKKYSPMGEINAFAAQYAETLHKTCELTVLITDRDAVIACAGVPKKDFLDKPLSREIESIIESRTFFSSPLPRRSSAFGIRTGEESEPQQRTYATDQGEESGFCVSCAMPIINEGDLIGCVVSLRRCDAVSQEPGSIDADTEAKLIKTAAGFLAKQMES